jgi:hypothetical protein
VFSMRAITAMAISRTAITVTDRLRLAPSNGAAWSGLDWTPDAARWFASAEAE